MGINTRLGINTSEDRKFHNAFTDWLRDSAALYYDSPEDALKDAHELIDTWGINWMENAREAT